GRSGSRTASGALRRERRRTCAPGISDRFPNSATGSGCRGRHDGSSRAAMLKAGAALIAIACWAGIAIQFAQRYGGYHDFAATAWSLLRFFTITTSLGLAVAMTLVALGRRVSPFVLGGLTLAALLVGAVYALLLSGLRELHGP